MRTTNPAIRAIGDVKGGLQFTYISLDDYRIIREDLFGAGERRTDDREPVSYSVFMDPPLARVGLSETEARNMAAISTKGRIQVQATLSALKEMAGWTIYGGLICMIFVLVVPYPKRKLLT